MKKFILTLIVCTLWLNAQAQNNNVWSLPPNYLKFPILSQPQSLPTPTGFFTYNGQPAENCHNAMVDAKGNLLFFIVDSAVYDNEGYLIDYLVNYDGASTKYIKGTAEIAIVPDPFNCKRFYIIAGGRKNYSSGFSNKLPYYAILDLSKPNMWNPGRLGALLDDPNTGTTAFSIADFTPNFEVEAVKQGGLFIAVSNTSKFRSDNSLLVFISNGYGIFRYKIDALGFHYDNYFIPYLTTSNPYPSFNQLSMRGEMELIELPNGNYRIASPFIYEKFIPPSTIINKYVIFTAELDNSGNLISGTKKLLFFDLINSPVRPYFHGLEFSPDGTKLYITHNSSPNYYPNPIEYYDFNNPLTGVQPLLVNNANDFESSQIEMGLDGRLYFATSNRLAALAIPNSPNPANWNDNVQSINYDPNYEGVSTQDYNLKSYILPDQIDGMDYTAYATVNTECCLFYSASGFDKESFTAYSGVQTWTPGSNPINNTATVTIYKKLVIPANATVTIKNMTFKFAPDAYVLVERGGSLILDNSTFTVYDECGSGVLWQGVFVEGTPNSSQFAIANRGRLELKNNSNIELAWTAAHNYGVLTNSDGLITGTDWNKVGGIIQSNNSFFTNNIRDVEFLQYHNVYNNKRFSDISRFDNTSFITDATLFNMGLFPKNHVTMWDVKNVMFVGCTFENTSTVYSYHRRGNGIYSIDATYTVTQKCTSGTIPCSSYQRSQFKNLFKGVYALAGSNGNIVNINHTDFENVWRSIYLKGMKYPVVTENNFDIGMNWFNLLLPHRVSYGLYLDNSTFYKVQNNNFYTSYNGYLGIYVNNSGEKPNEIYRNEFHDLTRGCQTEGENGDERASGNQTGLQFKCNNYFNTSEYDIYIPEGSIKNQQGLCGTISSPANNLFSYTAAGDFWVNSLIYVNNYVNYNYSETTGFNLEPRNGNYNNNTTSKNNCNQAPSCPSQSCPYDPALSCPNRNTIRYLGNAGGISTLRMRYDSLKQLQDSLKNVIDNGDTQALMAAINNSSIPNWQLRNMLLNASPYLSNEVLIALINAYPMRPAWLIQQILTENAPLYPDVLIALVNQPGLADYLVRNLLVNNGPVIPEVLNAFLSSPNHFSPWVVDQVLSLNAPLSNSTLLLFLENNYPNYLVRNVMNDNSPLSSDVYSAFINHVPPYPKWVTKNVDDAGAVEEHYVYRPSPFSPKMELDLQIAELEAQLYEIKGDFVRICLLDTTGAYSERDVIDFAKTRCKEDRCLITNMCIAIKDYTGASQYADTLKMDSKTATLGNFFSDIIDIKTQEPAKEEAAIKDSASYLNKLLPYTADSNSIASILSGNVIMFFTDTQTIELVKIQSASANNNLRMLPSNDEEQANQPLAEKKIGLYPNPSNGKIYITLSNVSSVDFTLYDLTGKMLFQSTGLNQSTNELDISHLNPGIYIFEVSTKNEVLKHERLVIMK